MKPKIEATLRRAADVNLKEAYQVPRTVDVEGREWKRCISDMHFSTARVGWAVGSTQILHTKDGGKTWVNQFKEDAGCSFLNPHRVFAVNEQICWITAISSATEIRCCYTTDGGRIWQGKAFGPDRHPGDIFFVDSKRGWLISDDGRLPTVGGKLHLTTDGGQNWDTYDLRIKGKPFKIQFHTPKIGWLLEHYLNKNGTKTYSRLHVSHDGGCSWRVLTQFDRRILDLHALSKNELLVVGETGFISKTSDGGITWKPNQTGSRANVNAINFYDSQLGIATADSATLLLTRDYGIRWKKIRSRDDVGNFISSHFSSKTQGVLASDASILTFTAL